MIVGARAAGGTWWGASHSGHDDWGTPCSSAAPSSSARAARWMTWRGGASRAGWSATVAGSGTGTSCSERIRGQRAAIGLIEFEGISDEVIGRFTVTAVFGQRRPKRGIRRRNREIADDPRVEAAKATARGVGDQPRQSSQPTAIEERGERRGIGGIERGDAIGGVERDDGAVRNRGRKPAGEVPPDDAMRRERQRGAEQLPRRSTTIVRASEQSLLVRSKARG